MVELGAFGPGVSRGAGMSMIGSMTASTMYGSASMPVAGRELLRVPLEVQELLCDEHELAGHYHAVRVATRRMLASTSP